MENRQIHGRSVSQVSPGQFEPLCIPPAPELGWVGGQPLGGSAIDFSEFCIMEDMSIRKELTQIIRFLIERIGEGVV